MGDYLDNNKRMGLNVRKLFSLMAAQIAVPPGGGMGSALEVLTNPDKLKAVHRQAIEQVEQALAAIKAAPDNPYGDDDEVIAAEIVRKIEEKQQDQLRDFARRRDWKL